MDEWRTVGRAEGVVADGVDKLEVSFDVTRVLMIGSWCGSKDPDGIGGTGGKKTTWASGESWCRATSGNARAGPNPPCMMPGSGSQVIVGRHKFLLVQNDRRRSQLTMVEQSDDLGGGGGGWGEGAQSTWLGRDLAQLMPWRHGDKKCVVLVTKTCG